MRKVMDWAGVPAAFAVAIVVNGLANALPLGGKSTGEVSALYESLITPAGFTFAIWSLIYLWLLVYVIFQALPAQRDSQLLASVGKWFIISCVFNAAWMFCWHYLQIELSVIMMLGIFYSLIKINLLLSRQSLTPQMYWCVSIPFSIYVGWITVATIANLSGLQTAWDANSLWLSAIDWTLLKLAIAGFLGAVVALTRLNAPYVLVIAWAANGIAAKQIGTAAVSGAATTLSILAILIAVYVIFRRLRPE